MGAHEQRAQYGHMCGICRTGNRQSEARAHIPCARPDTAHVTTRGRRTTLSSIAEKKASIRYGQTPCIGDCEAFLSETRMPTSWTRQSASFGHAAYITRGTHAPPLGWAV